MSESFIENVIHGESESEKDRMIRREFNGLEAVKHSAENECDEPIPSSEEGGDE